MALIARREVVRCCPCTQDGHCPPPATGPCSAPASALSRHGRLVPLQDQRAAGCCSPRPGPRSGRRGGEGSRGRDAAGRAQEAVPGRQRAARPAWKANALCHSFGLEIWSGAKGLPESSRTPGTQPHLPSSRTAVTRLLRGGHGCARGAGERVCCPGSIRHRRAPSPCRAWGRIQPTPRAPTLPVTRGAPPGHG